PCGSPSARRSPRSTRNTATRRPRRASDRSRANARDDGRGPSLRRNTQPDRAAHAGAAQAAIAVGGLGEVLLGIVLGVVERGRVDDLGGYGAHAVLGELLLEHGERGLGLLLLLGREGVDAGAVLRADIVALAHALRRVVAFPEDLEERLVGGLLRVEPHH